MKNLKERILNALKESEFITPNESAFQDEEFSSVMNAIQELVDDEILIKRECEGIAYELRSNFPKCFKDNMPSNKCYGAPYTTLGAVPRKCVKCSHFAFGSK
nr:hypothetical protein [uncultured Cellulosilyticum sp.]